MASIGENRKREYSVSEMVEGKSVCVHGVPVSLSPVKKSRKNPEVTYFEGQISDGKKCARFVSFETGLLAEMEKGKDKELPLALDRSDVKCSKLSGELEVHLNKKSGVALSPRKFSNVALPREMKTDLGSIVSLTMNQPLDVLVKVVKMNDVTMVKKADGTELTKQDVVIGDRTGCCRYKIKDILKLDRCTLVNTYH